VLPIVGVIFGLGLLAGAILHPPAGTDPFATAARERGAFSWSRYRFAEFNPQATYPAEVLRVIDGDTFEARVRIWSGFEINTRVRLRAIDAPELHARCASEYLKAEAARAALQRILSAGGVTSRRSGPTNIAAGSMRRWRHATRRTLRPLCSRAASRAAMMAAGASPGVDD
jgi:hypothetical protein